MSNTMKMLAVVGAIAVVAIAAYAINESGKSDVEKLGDSIEEAGRDLEDAVEDAVD